MTDDAARPRLNDEEMTFAASVPILAYLGFRPIAAPPPGTYSVEMPIGPTNVNKRGVPHGGAIATLIDHTGGHAATVLLGRSGPSVDLVVRFLTTPSGSTL